MEGNYCETGGAGGKISRRATIECGSQLISKTPLQLKKNEERNQKEWKEGKTKEGNKRRDRGRKEIGIEMLSYLNLGPR